MPGITLTRTLEVLRRGMDAGLHTGAQVSAFTAGGAQAHLAVGRNGAAAPMSDDTLVPWMCAARPLLALGLCGLLESREGWLDAPVAAFLPEYAQGGKEQVTVRHLLTHTTGVQHDPVAAIFRLPWPEALRRACAVPAGEAARPGEEAAYQGGSYWYLVGELIMRASGDSLSHYLRERVLLPLGLTQTWFGMPGPEYRRNQARLGRVVTRAGGTDAEVAADEELFCTGQGPVAPRGPARDLAFFYNKLLARDVPAGLVSPRTLAAMTVPARVGLADRAWAGGGKIVDWSLLAMIESRKYGRRSQLFGRRASGAAFGHSGELGVVGMCDPELGVAAAFAVNTVLEPVSHYLRVQSICTAIMEDIDDHG